MRGRSEAEKPPETVDEIGERELLAAVVMFLELAKASLTETFECGRGEKRVERDLANLGWITGREDERRLDISLAHVGFAGLEAAFAICNTSLAPLRRLFIDEHLKI